MHEPGNLLGTGGTDAFDTVKPGLYIAIRHAGPMMLVAESRKSHGSTAVSRRKVS